MRANRGIIQRVASVIKAFGYIGAVRFLAWLLKTQLVKPSSAGRIA
jgi:hypothetical protein